MPSLCAGWAVVAVLILHAGLWAGASVSMTTLGASVNLLVLMAEPNQVARDEASVPERARPVSEAGKPSPLLAWWRFDESEGRIAVDSSGHGFAGTLIGNPRWQPTGGRVKGALAFDGAQDAVLIGNAPAFNITGAITIAAWIKVSRFDQRWQTIIAKGDTAWRLQRAAQENTVAFHCTGLNSVKGRWPLGIEGTKNINDGQWHHVTGVYDGAVVSLYVDGILDNSSRASGAIQVNGLPVVIGANAEASGRNWSGLIDEVCVFACALNANGVQALYAGQDPAVLVEQASALVSDEDIQAEQHAAGEDHANTASPGEDVTPSDKQGSRRGALVVLLVAGVALTAGMYVVQRRRSNLR